MGPFGPYDLSRVAERRISACLGVARWKRAAISALLYPHEPIFARSGKEAMAAARAHGGAIAVWASSEPVDLAARAAAEGAELVRMEDGFVRSSGLGAECRPPASIVLDWRGAHFDPRRPSDLEALLSEKRFDTALLERAGHLVQRIVASRVTKYNLGRDSRPLGRDGRRTVLVPGQVEDDLSVRLGGAGIRDNLELLRRVRAREPDSVIIYRPHPDVEAGLRRGAQSDADVLRLADRIDRGLSIDALMAGVDALHVLTSLTGFEALLRGREVVVHGQPFYAGWGLTHDLAPLPRRTRRLSVTELAAGALILYPRYLSPATGLRCSPEALVEWLAQADRPRPAILPMARKLEARARRLTGMAPAAGRSSANG